MIVRLIKLVVGLYYGSLDLPGCNVKLHTAPKVLDQHQQEHSRLASAKVLFRDFYGYLFLNQSINKAIREWSDNQSRQKYPTRPTASWIFVGKTEYLVRSFLLIYLQGMSIR